MGGNRLHGLDAMRGVAALLVLLHHLAFIYGQDWQSVPFPLMVDLFFILSGYVMARSFERRMDAGLSTFGFMWMRYRRLWAPVALGTIVGASVLLWTGQDPAMIALALLPNILLFPAPTLQGPFLLNPPGWSIYFELIANLFHPAILRKAAVPALIGLSLISLAVLVYSADGLRVTYLYAFARVFASYPLGIVLWRVFGDFDRLPVWPIWPAMLALPGLPALMYFADVPIWAEPLAILLLPPLLLCGLRAPDSRIFRQVARTLGTLSFPLYAIHFPVIQLVEYQGGPEWLAVLLSILAAVAVSMVVGRKFSAGAARLAAPQPS